MKKIIAAAALTAMFISGAWADQSGQSWARLYRRLPDIKQKYAILQNITPLDDRTLEPFFEESLNDLVYGDLSKYRESRNTYDDWEILTRTIVRELGEIKGQTASETIWDVVETAEVPLLKAEALISLGQMRAVEYGDEIAVILRNLNFNTRGDKESAEIEAYGAVVCLDKMKHEDGFEPLFYAAIGWYSDRVTSIAYEAVLTALDDPIPELTRILEDADDYNDKRAALEMALGTDASADEKSSIAVIALGEGLRYAENDYSLQRQLANLRMEAINALITFGAGADGAPRLLDKAVDEGDMDEKLVALVALGLDGGDDAAGRLAKRLQFYNERQASGLGLNRDELVIVKQLIYALGESGNPLGLDPLTEMTYLDYTPALIREAREASDRIQGD